MDNREIIDITPLISPEIAVFPGDTQFKRKELLSFEKGHNLVLSSIESTVHLGAHTDAPSHYHKDGRTIEQQDLSTYMGKVQVIEVDAIRGERINCSHLEGIDIEAPRVLLKTNSFPDPNNWNNDFNSIDSELIDYLYEKKVMLIGIDTPSVDPADDKELLTHNQIYNYGLAILEGIVLTKVDPGLYDLIALPLPIKNSDASPVRAVLLK